MKKLFLVFAHPEDEAFVVGKTVAKYAKLGWQIERIFAISDRPGELQQPIFRQMLQDVPDIVITFEPSGITNNSDHRNISQAATFAFQKYAVLFEKKFPGADQPKLYYACAPHSQVSYLQKKQVIPQEAFGKPWVGTDDKKVTTVIDDEYFYLRMVGTKEAYPGKHDRISDRL